MGSESLVLSPPFLHPIQQLFCYKMYKKKTEEFDILLKYIDENIDKVIEAIYQVVSELSEELKDNAQVLGPITPYIAFEKDVHKRSILIKYRDEELIKTVIKKIIDKLKNKTIISITVNIDPYNF